MTTKVGQRDKEYISQNVQFWGEKETHIESRNKATLSRRVSKVKYSGAV